MVSPAEFVVSTMSASESNLRCSREEWPACIGRRDNNLPRPILFFVAAEKNGSACSSCRDNDLPRPILFFVAAKKNGPPAAAIAQRGPRPILIFVAAKKNGPPAAAVAATIFRVRF